MHEKSTPLVLPETSQGSLADVPRRWASAEPGRVTFSVRSGAALSMPGMMNTILNLGLSDASVEGLAKKTGNPRFAYDSYRRLIDMFGCTAMGCEHEAFEHAISAMKQKKGVKLDTDLTADVAASGT